MTHGQCDAKPTVALSATKKASPLIIPRLHSGYRQHCLQWCNGSLITRYQWSVTDARFTSAVMATASKSRHVAYAHELSRLDYGTGKRHAVRSARQSDYQIDTRQVAVSHERRCSIGPFCAEIRACHSTAPWPSLATGAWTDRV